MYKDIFQITHEQRLDLDKYVKVFEDFNKGSEDHNKLQSRCVEYLVDDILYVRWNSHGHMMGWKRISQETKIPIEIIKYFRDTEEYKKSVMGRLKIIGIDMIDGLSMKKNRHPSDYISKKFGIKLNDVSEILNSLEPRKELVFRSFSEPSMTNIEIQTLVSRTQRYLQHKIDFDESKEISQESIQWILKRRYKYSLILAAKAAGMIFALKRHAPCRRCLVPIYAEKIDKCVT